jgi:hypothetical protein
MGITHCSFFTDRLYDYSGATNGTTPSLDSASAANLWQRK